MTAAIETVGCWLWDNFRPLAVAAMSANLAGLLVVDGYDGNYPERAVLDGGLGVTEVVLRVGAWADGRRLAKRPALRLVIDLTPEARDDPMVQLVLGHPPRAGIETSTVADGK